MGYNLCKTDNTQPNGVELKNVFSEKRVIKPLKRNINYDFLLYNGIIDIIKQKSYVECSRIDMLV